MKKTSRKGAAVIAALSVTVIILGIIAFVPQEREHPFAEIQPPAAPGIVHIELMNTPITSSVTISVPAQTPEAMPTPAPTATPVPEKENEDFFTLDILNDTISVAYGVEEATLTRMPGWLPSSALPGQDGMCVVYGHRNRNHLKALENVERGDAITVAMDGVAYVYTVSDIMIYDSTDDFRLPTMDGKTLALATCYPFRYSGHAPGKVAFLLSQQDDDFNQENSDRYDR